MKYTKNNFCTKLVFFTLLYRDAGQQNTKFDCKKLKNIEGKLTDNCMVFLKSLTNISVDADIKNAAYTCGSEYGDKKDSDIILNEACGHSAVLYFKRSMRPQRSTVF